MLVIADAERADRGRRRHGRRRLRGDARHDQTIVFESAYFNAAVGAAHEQDARPEDRSEHALRARRRPAPAGDGDGARVRAARADRRRHARAAPWSIAIPCASSRRCCGCGATRSRACSASTIPDADVRRILESLGFALRDGRATAGTSPCRRAASTCCAKSISSRRSRGTTASIASRRRSRR